MNPQVDKNFVDSVVISPTDRTEYTFTIRVNGRMSGLIGLKDIDRAGELFTGGVFTDLAVYGKLNGDS